MLRVRQSDDSPQNSDALSEGEMDAPSSEDLSQDGLSLEDLGEMGTTTEPTDMSELQSSPLDMLLQEAERTVDSVEEGRPMWSWGQDRRRTSNGSSILACHDLLDLVKCGIGGLCRFGARCSKP